MSSNKISFLLTMFYLHISGKLSCYFFKDRNEKILYKDPCSKKTLYFSLNTLYLSTIAFNLKLSKSKES